MSGKNYIIEEASNLSLIKFISFIENYKPNQTDIYISLPEMIFLKPLKECT